jgi:hypothetical protein
MQRIEDVILDYYESNDDFGRAEERFKGRLMKFKKEELTQFIVDMQNRGCFRGICYKE